MAKKMTFVSYAEKNNQPTFDWNHFLRQPDHTYQEISYATSLASQWVTCACGNLCEILPRIKQSEDSYRKGQPTDRYLADLGISFYEAIGRLENLIKYEYLHDQVYSIQTLYEYQVEARIVLEKIEERAQILINRLYP